MRKAVIPVAGLGTRMLPATKAIPKELVPVAGKPAVQWIVEDAVASGVEEIVFVTSADKTAVLAHFEAAPALERVLEARGRLDLLDVVTAPARLAQFRAATQAQPLGLGHAVLAARDAIGVESFAVLLPDEILRSRVPALAQCLEVDGADCVIGLARVPRSDAPRYGMVSVRRELDARTFELDGMVEKPAADAAPSDLAITGPYVLPPGVFDVLERLPSDTGREVQLTDALRELAGSTRFIGRIVEGERLDVGHLLGFLQANVALALEQPGVGPALEAWLRERLR